MKSGTCGTLLLLLLLSLFLLLPSARSEGVWCYQCGTGVEGQPDCEDFARASSWTQFWRQCAPDSVCVKSKPAWDEDKLERQTVRGCSPGTSLQGARHQEGCWTHPTISHALTCYCHTSLCNSAHDATLTTTHTQARVLLVLLLLLFCVMVDHVVVVVV